MQYCSTCLCSDRRLRPLKDLEQVTSMVILLDLELDVMKDAVCWECEFRFAKIHSFRKQVQDAQKHLKLWHASKNLPKILRKCNLKPLTRLTIARKDRYDKMYLTETEEQCEKMEEDSTDSKYDIQFVEAEWIGCEDNDQETYKSEQIPDEDISVLIVAEQEDKADSESEQEDSDIILDEVMKISKEEENFIVTRMTMEEMLQSRELDKNATVFKRCTHKCLMCITGYYQENKFDRHLKLRHDVVFEGKPRNFKCSICETRFSRRCALKTHYDKHFRKYTCKMCDFTHHKLATMFMHKIKKHKQGTAYTCRICKIDFDRRHALDWHLKTHKEKPECDVCGKTFSSKTNLKGHMTIHAAPNNVQCTECGRWVRESYLPVHMRTHKIQSDDSMYCVECNQHFTSVAFYKRHMARSSRHREQTTIQ